MTIKDVALNEFVARFTSQDVLKGLEVRQISRHLYGVPRNMASATIESSNLFSIGIFIGYNDGAGFHPSFPLLDAILPFTDKKVIVNEKAGWLFICGRDVLKQGIMSSPPGLTKGDLVLVQNERQECLGYGEWRDERSVLVKRILDRGDFLRRER